VVVVRFGVGVVVGANTGGMVVLVVTGVDNLIDGVVVAVVVVELIEGMLGLVVEGIENLVADVEGVEGVVRGFVVAENEGNNEVGVVDAVLGVSVVSFEIFKVL
ncbi:10592_t:CDS:1, partial [Entrophospora sp. SA101]